MPRIESKSKLGSSLAEVVPDFVGLSCTKSAWAGPTDDGTTQSIASRYYSCPERFRIMVIDGLKPVETFRSPIEYGNMWHLCEEYHAKNESWEEPLIKHAKILQEEYRFQQEEVLKWYHACRLQFPVYINWWKDNEEVVARTPILQEEKFSYMHKLPSGRYARLRGKFDSVDFIGTGKNAVVYLQENKTKANIDESQLRKQLTYDLQTMFYLIALRNDPTVSSRLKGKPVAGVRYNVVRRPLSGGKGSIKQLNGSKNVAAETLEQYHERLEKVFTSEPEYHFMRWKVEVSDVDIAAFTKQTLNPTLENMLDDYEWWDFCKTNDEDRYNTTLQQQQFPHHVRRHFRIPYGIYNPLAEGKPTEVDEYLRTGSTVGLTRVTNFFPELT